MSETIYAAEWPGFPGETAARDQARCDIEALDGTFGEPVMPDWLTMTEVYKINETDVPVPAYEKAGWRERAKRIMGRAGEAVREAAISTMAMVQAKTEAVGTYYSDTEQGSRRRRIAGAVAGAVVLGGLMYMEYKGVGGSAAVRHVQKVHAPEHIRHARHVAEVALHTGDNPWTVTEDQLHAHGVAHPSEPRVAADDLRLIRLNHISQLQSLTLQVGQKLKLLKVW